MIITITRTLLIHCEGIKIDTVMTYTHWLCLWPEGSFYYQILTDHTCVRALISNYKLCLMLDVLHTIHVTVTLVFADRRWSQCTDESSHPTMLCGSNYLSNSPNPVMAQMILNKRSSSVLAIRTFWLHRSSPVKMNNPFSMGVVYTIYVSCQLLLRRHSRRDNRPWVVVSPELSDTLQI